MTQSEKAKIRRKSRPKSTPQEDPTLPQRKVKNLTFFPVPEFSDAEVGFGANADRYFSRADTPQVPAEFETMVSTWFFLGGKIPTFHNSVDPEKARRAICSLLRSFAPAHEAKIATVAYAVWLWTHPTALN